MLAFLLYFYYAAVANFGQFESYARVRKLGDFHAISCPQQTHDQIQKWNVLKRQKTLPCSASIYLNLKTISNDYLLQENTHNEP